MPLKHLTLVAALAGAACSLAEDVTPPFTGPSGLGLSMSLSASPDSLPQDGRSQSELLLVARDTRGRPVPNLAATIDIEGDATPLVDAGRLSARLITTNAEGRATARYTAPVATRIRAAERVVGIVFTPVGTDFVAAPRRVLIRLRPG